MGPVVSVRKILTRVLNDSEVDKCALKAKLKPLSAPTATSLSVVKKLRPITRKELSQLAKLTPAAYHTSLLRLYATRLGEVGLIGQGTITLQHLKSAQGAAAYPKHGLIVLSTAKLRDNSARELSEIFIHELLHLCRRPGAADSYIAVEEVTTSLLTAAIHHRLHPSLPVRKHYSGFQYAYYNELRSWRALYRAVKPKNSLLDWTWKMHVGATGVLEQAERALKRNLAANVVKTLQKSERYLRTVSFVRRFHTEGYHAFCGHTWLDQFLLLGSRVSEIPNSFPTYIHDLMGPPARSKARYADELAAYNVAPFLKL